MDAVIREYRPDDEEAVVALSLRAWAPVFASLEHVLGGEISRGLHGDWRQYQQKAVRNVLADPAMQVWVAQAAPGAVGMVAAMLHRERLIGEIVMLAVDPDRQHRGDRNGNDRGRHRLAARRGMRVAMVETGGDPGHAPARRVYENAGYTPLPVARYFRPL